MNSTTLLTMINDFMKKTNSCREPDFSRAEPVLQTQFLHILIMTKRTFPDLEPFVTSFSIVIHNKITHVKDVRQVCRYIKDTVRKERNAAVQIAKMKIFLGAKEKLEEAANAFRIGDNPGTFNHLNTCLELILKSKFRIPTTIKGINTASIIEVAVSQKIGPIKFLEEAKKRISELDNQVKHKGYNPSKVECINALRCMEELIKELESDRTILTDSFLEKVYAGIEFRK